MLKRAVLEKGENGSLNTVSQGGRGGKGSCWFTLCDEDLQQ